jgi:plasmid stabilization system protein ParE
VKPLQLKIAQTAFDQIQDQVLHIAEDSIDHALQWEDRLLTAIKKLRDFSGHAIDEDARQRLGRIVHKMVFEKTYVIHYIVDENAGLVTVVNFRHGARLPRPDEP